MRSPSHPAGRFKAAFFQPLGYKAEDWRQLESDIRLILANEAITRKETKYGQKYEVQGIVRTPSGQKVESVTV